MNLIGDFGVHQCNVNMTRWRYYLHSLNINHKYFGSDPIVSHISKMGCLSKGNLILSSVRNYDLLQLQKYCEELIFPLKYHTQITEAGVQYIATCTATRISEEDYSTLVSLRPIKTSPIIYDILKQVEEKKIQGNRNSTSGVGDKMQPLSCQSER